MKHLFGAGAVFALAISTGMDVQNPSREPETLANRSWTVPVPSADLCSRACQPAVDESLLKRTSTVEAPWTIVEGNNKKYARVKAIETVVNRIKKRLE